MVFLPKYLDPRYSPEARALWASRRRFSAAVRDYFNRLDSAGLRVTAYDAANARLIDRLVEAGGNFWPDSGAFNAMAGYLFPSAGTLVPLHPNHDAGTMVDFVTGDWNAVTGLKGDGSTKHVNSNRNNNADGQDDQALGVYCSEAVSTTISYRAWIGSGTSSGSSLLNFRFASVPFVFRSRSSSSFTVSEDSPTEGYHGISRDNSENFEYRVNSDLAGTGTQTSQIPSSDLIYIFGVPDISFCPSRFPFYNLGPNLSGTGELALMDDITTEWVGNLSTS